MFLKSYYSQCPKAALSKCQSLLMTAELKSLKLKEQNILTYDRCSFIHRPNYLCCLSLICKGNRQLIQSSQKQKYAKHSFMAGTVFNSHVTDRCDQKFILDQDYKQWEINLVFEIEIFCNIEKKVFIFTFEFSFTSASTVTLSI